VKVLCLLSAQGRVPEGRPVGIRASCSCGVVSVAVQQAVQLAGQLAGRLDVQLAAQLAVQLVSELAVQLAVGGARCVFSHCIPEAHLRDPSRIISLPTRYAPFVGSSSVTKQFTGVIASLMIVGRLDSPTRY